MNHKEIITYWKEAKIPKTLPRNLNISLENDFITVITGPRRSGKSYLCFQTIEKLISKGINKNNILYLNFEDNKLIGAKAEDLDKLLEAYFLLFDIDKKNKIYLFFDEIQAVIDWDSWTRKIYDSRKDIVLILTGSSSKMLSREISTKLRGRTLNVEVFPLSFKEYLDWKNIKFDIRTISYSKEKINLIKSFDNYVKIGGYPAISAEEISQSQEVLQGYYESMILKDVVERYNVADVKKLKTLANFLFESVSKEISYTNLANKLNSLGFKVSKNTVVEYTNYLEEAYLFFQNLKYEYSLMKQLGSIKKLYCIDNGLLNAVSFKFSDDIGKLLENLIYIELKRRKNTIYYHRKDYECDFLIVKKNKVFSAIQVTQKLNEDNLQREKNGLFEVMELHKLKEGLILTSDQEDEIIEDGKKILVKPIWKWLLEEIND